MSRGLLDQALWPAVAAAMSISVIGGDGWHACGQRQGLQSRGCCKCNL